ncbi:MAG: glycosyltransferase family 2 protein [Thermodesulfobacteriota bacterium]
MNALFSIITVVRDAAFTIGNCIESVQNQSYPAGEIEHIVVDGASTDGTLVILEKFRNCFDRVISEPDGGIYDAMNKGITMASGNVIGILNADDFYPTPNVLESVAGVFEDPSIDSCYGDLVYVDPENTDRAVRYWRAGDYDAKRFYWGWMPPHPTFFVRRNVYEKYGLFNLDLGSAADYELMLRFLLKNMISTAYIPKVLVKMRTGGKSNASFMNRYRANRNDKLAWNVNNLQPYPWTFIFKPLRKISQFIDKPANI